MNRKQLSALLEKAVNAAVDSQTDAPEEFFATYFARLASNPSVVGVKARQVLDSRGNPTVQADIVVSDLGETATLASEAAPSGASTGAREAKELHDGDKTVYRGRGVTKAVKNVVDILQPEVLGQDPRDLLAADRAMLAVSGDKYKTATGGNATTAVSFAMAVAGAKTAKVPLYEHFSSQFQKLTGREASYKMPRPMANVLNGGKHAGGELEIQEFMIIPAEKYSFARGVRVVVEVYHALSKVLTGKYGVGAKNVGDEGGFAPSSLKTAKEALEAISEATVAAGYTVGVDIFFALDCAASEFFVDKEQKYRPAPGVLMTSEELVQMYVDLVADFPALVSIEDGMDENDQEGWALLTEKLGSQINIVGDDLYTTNTEYIQRGIEEKWANALLLKVNQIGTITEAMEAAELMFKQEEVVIVSHRSGETVSAVISDLAVGIGAQFVKIGAPARGERVSKYNRLLQIEEELGLVTTAAES